MRDYAELVKALWLCSEPTNECPKCPRYGTDNCHGVFKDAADAIEELQSELVTIRNQLPKWISVGADQKCPVSATACVIGYFNGGKYDQLWWFDFISTDKNGVIAPNNTDIEGRCIAVYALPEPPKEVE